MGRNSLKILLGFLVIYGNTAFAQNQPSSSNVAKATFTIDNTVYDYGTIFEQEGLANHTFTITNTGKNPLVIKQVVASCGCTTPNWTKAPIASGKSGEVKVAFNPKGRSGPFTKSISVYCENADPVQLTLKGNIEKGEPEQPKIPVFTTNESSHNFGTIGENDGYAEHIFRFKNTGTAPLIISRVSASCGCTRPEWTDEPIEPGKEGVIIITFNPKGRVGNFNKTATVYTNEDGGSKRHRLTILGTVVDRPTEDPFVQYIDTIADVCLEKKDLSYNTFNTTGVNKNVIRIKNGRTETAYFAWENVPDYISVRCPDSLKADWPAEIVVNINGEDVSEKRGRITDSFVWIVKDRNGKELGRETLAITVNYIDDFSQISPLQAVSAPSLQIENTQIEFGEVKSGFLGLFRGSASRSIVLTNKGKSDLIIHSISSDDPRVHLPEMKVKTIKAGDSLRVDATIKVKELETEPIDTDIFVICNDPKGPIRMIKVTAQKTK